MSKLQPHVYRGYNILPCVWEGSKRWHVQTWKNDGLVLDERESPQAATLRDAKDWIDRDASTAVSSPPF